MLGEQCYSASLNIKVINTTRVNFYNFLFILSLKIKLKYYSFYQTTTLSRSEIIQYNNIFTRSWYLNGYIVTSMP